MADIPTLALTFLHAAQDFVSGNLQSLIIGGSAALAGRKLLTRIHRELLFKGYIAGNEIIFTITNYEKTNVINPETGETYTDQFIDTKASGTNLEDIFSGTSGKVVIEYIHDARRLSTFGTSNRILVPFAMASKMILKKELFPQKSDNLLELIEEISQKKFKDPKKRAFITGEIKRKLINFICTNADIKDKIFDNTPLPQSLKEATLYKADNLPEGIDREDIRPVRRRIYPVLIFEKAAKLTQMRIFLIRDFELDPNALPKPENLRVHLGNGIYIHDKKSHLNQRLRSMKSIVEDLNSDAIIIEDPDLPNGGLTMAQTLGTDLEIDLLRPVSEFR